MKHLKRYAALCMALVVACSAMAVPASATDYQSTYNFWNWAYDNSWFLGKAIIGFSAGNVCQVSEDGLHHATSHTSGFAGGGRDGERVYSCVCDHCGEEFQAVATDLQQTYYKSVDDTDIKSVNSSGQINYCNWWWPDVIGQATKVAMGIDYVSYYYSGNQSISWGPATSLTVDEDTAVYVQKSGFYSISTLPELGPISTGTPTIYYYDGSKQVSVSTTETNGYLTFTAVSGREYWICITCPNTLYKDSSFNLAGVTETYYCDYPEIYLTSPLVPLERPNEFNPSFTYEDGDGWQVHVGLDGNKLIDETNLTYYNPVTNTTTNIQNWSYDYSDRSYTVLTDSNNTTTITYGDEYITINEGDNITYNIYYYTAPDSSGDGDSSGSDGSGDDDGGGLLDKIGELIGSVLGGFIDVIGAALGKVIDSLIDLVTLTIDKLVNVINLFGSFGDALGVLWSWLPEEVVTVLVSGVTVIVFASVIKLFMR